MDKIIKIAKFYNAKIAVHSNTAVIHYPVLGQGSAMSGDIEELFDAVRIKMIPSERKLEVELL